MPRPTIVRSANGELLVERFSPARRVEHVIVIITFVTLCLTGFPQTFDDSASGHWLLKHIGGLETARLIHRSAGLVFGFHAVVHLLVIARGALTRSMQMTLLPLPKDLRDAWHTMRYYFGLEQHAPELPKFDYRQKFEYIGLILGGLLMVSSGLILIFPVFTARYLPADLIPAAHVAHSNEALLALSVLVIWHIYGAVLSPEIFPLDRTMLTGTMTPEELKQRHALEYKRLFPHGHEQFEHPTPGSTPPLTQSLEKLDV